MEGAAPVPGGRVRARRWAPPPPPSGTRSPRATVAWLRGVLGRDRAFGAAGSASPRRAARQCPASLAAGFRAAVAKALLEDIGYASPGGLLRRYLLGENVPSGGLFGCYLRFHGMPSPGEVRGSVLAAMTRTAGRPRWTRVRFGPRRGGAGSRSVCRGRRLRRYYESRGAGSDSSPGRRVERFNIKSYLLLFKRPSTSATARARASSRLRPVVGALRGAIHSRAAGIVSSSRDPRVVRRVPRRLACRCRRSLETRCRRRSRRRLSRRRAWPLASTRPAASSARPRSTARRR